MRVEIAGAQLTESVVDVIETLQTQPEILAAYRRTVSALSRMLILSADDIDDLETMAHLRALQMMMRDLEAMAFPAGVDDPGNDIPAATL